MVSVQAVGVRPEPEGFHVAPPDLVRLASACLLGDVSVGHDGGGEPAGQPPDLTQKRNGEAKLERWRAGLSRKPAVWSHGLTNARSSLPS